MANNARSLLQGYKEKTNAPTTVRWASNIYYILSIIVTTIGILAIIGFLVFALVILTFGNVAGSQIASELGILTLAGGIIFMTIGAAMIAIGVAGLFVARGLRRGHTWAMITAVIVSVVYVLVFIFSLSNVGVADIAITAAHLFVLYALVADRSAKKFFK